MSGALSFEVFPSQQDFLAVRPPAITAGRTIAPAVKMVECPFVQNLKTSMVRGYRRIPDKVYTISPHRYDGIGVVPDTWTGGSG